MSVIEEHLKAVDPDLREPTLKLFHTNQSVQNTAYIAVSMTRSFTSSSGKPQPEFHGYILIKEGDSWRIDPRGRVRYTTTPTEADKILSGQK